MAKNHMADVAKMLGIEIGEEFGINLCPNVLFKFDMNGILAQEQGEASWHSANCGILQELIYGSFEIVKLPWKPKKGETFYSFDSIFAGCHGDDRVWKVAKCFWDERPADFAKFKAGWIYRTQEEAEMALPKVAAEMDVKYSL